jgi:hypothetical protein
VDVAGFGTVVAALIGASAFGDAVAASQRPGRRDPTSLRRHERASSGHTEQMADLIATVAEELIGWMPRRQPWRAVVAALYLLAAVIAIAVCTWLVITTS